MTIIWGRHAGATGGVDSAVFQRTVDCPDWHPPVYHVILGAGKVDGAVNSSKRLGLDQPILSFDAW